MGARFIIVLSLTETVKEKDSCQPAWVYPPILVVFVKLVTNKPAIGCYCARSPDWPFGSRSAFANVRRGL